MLELNFEPFPVIETERLMLRKISWNDAENIFALRADREVMKYIGRPIPKTVRDIEPLINAMNENTVRIQWGITLKENDGVIGTIGYHKIDTDNYRAEIGYLLGKDYWQTGLMSEAISSVIEYGFKQMQLHSIEAVITPGNEASRRLLKKFNFTKEGFFKENFFFEGKFWDSEVYSLLNHA